MFSSQINISKLTAHSPARIEPLQARLRTGRLLQTADFIPAGFPPQAILFLRRAVVTQPVSLASFHLRPEWVREMRVRVSEMYRRAVRPARGMVPAGAEAILFADEAEWLACLGVAVSRHEVERHWCWQAAVRERAVATPPTLVQAWTQSPRSLPAALMYLVQWERASEVLQILSEREAETIAAAVAAEWDVPHPISEWPRQIYVPAEAHSESGVTDFAPGSAGVNLAATFQSANEQATAPSSATSQDMTLTAAQAGKPALIVRTEAETVAPPWWRWMPHTEAACARLSLPARRLLALAIAIFHSPATARSPRFSRDLNAWLNPATPRQPEAAPPAPNRTRFPVSPAQSSNAQGNTIKADLPVSRLDAPIIGVEVPQQRKKQTYLAESPGRALEEMDAPEETPAAEDQQPGFSLEGQPTQLGGVLYLLNLFLHTDLPGCFDEQGELSEHLSGWGLAELLARALLGKMDDAECHDPIWAMLARLDGRQADEPPAADFQGRDDFYLPAGWLRQFAADEPWAIAQTESRLIAWHRTGNFVIVDRARRIGETSDLEEIAARYRAQGVAVRWEVDVSVPPCPLLLAWMEESPQWNNHSLPLRRWMSRTFPFLHYLLVWALGDAAGDRQTLAQMLLRKPGRLYCTATHVDLVMPLDQISLAVRCAGLDANPGWVRDLMRVVKFHFE